MNSTVGSTFYLAGKPGPGASAGMPFSKLPKPGQVLNGEYVVLENPPNFLGVLASDMRHPERRLVLQRAQGRLAYATREEVALYFSMPAHPNVATPLDILDARGTPVVASVYEPEGSLRAWLSRRAADGHRCWAAHPEVLPGGQVPEAPEDEDDGDDGGETQQKRRGRYVMTGFAPLWGPHTLRPKSYRPPEGVSVLRATLRDKASTLPPPEPVLRVTPPVSHVHTFTTAAHSRPPVLEVNLDEVLVRARMALHIARGLAALHAHGGLLHLDLNPGNVLVTRWLCPKVLHPRSTGKQVEYFGAKIKDHRAVVRRRVLYQSPAVVFGRPVHLCLMQAVPGKETLVAIATDIETGIDTVAPFSVAAMRQSGQLTLDRCVRRAVRALEKEAEASVAGLRGLDAPQSEYDPSSSIHTDASHTFGRPDTAGSWESLPASGLPGSPVGQPPDALRRKQHADMIAKALLHYGRGPHGWVDYIAPEQEALQPHEFLVEHPVFPGMPPPYVADTITDRTDMYSFGLVLCGLFSGAMRAMNPKQALNGLKFDMEPADEYVARAFPAAVVADCRLLETIASLAADCVNAVPECRPTAAIAVSLIESALQVAGAVVDPKVPHPDVIDIPPTQQRLNEAKYYAYGRRDWALAAELLLPMLPDPARALPTGTDWKHMFRLFKLVKHNLIADGLAGTVPFPYYEAAIECRGIPGALRLNIHPVHDLCMNGYVMELLALLRRVDIQLAPAAVRREMDKYYHSDAEYVRRLRDVTLRLGPVYYRGVLLGELNPDGDTPLQVACKAGHEDIVRVLLANNVDVAAPEALFGETPLHRAVASGSVRIVTALLERGADPEVPSLTGTTPLHVAAARNQVSVADVLLRWGAQTDVADMHGRCPIHIAIALAHPGMVKLLLSYGARVTQKIFRQVGVRVDKSHMESASDSAGRTKNLTIMHAVEAATRTQVTCCRPACRKRAKGSVAAGAMIRCERCRACWWCSPVCRDADAEDHTQSTCTPPPEVVWPVRGVVTPWGVGVLQGMHRVSVNGNREPPRLVDKRGRPKRVPVLPALPVDTVTTAVVVIPRPHATSPIRLALDNRTMRVYLGLEVAVKVHYDLTGLEPVEGAKRDPPPSPKRIRPAAVLSHWTGVMKSKQGPGIGHSASVKDLKPVPPVGTVTRATSERVIAPANRLVPPASPISKPASRLTVDTAESKVSGGGGGFVSRLKAAFSGRTLL